MISRFQLCQAMCRFIASTICVIMMQRSLMPADMLKDCATEQELYWMMEEEFELEERDEAAMDPNAVIDVKELAHRRQVGNVDPPRRQVHAQAMCEADSASKLSAYTLGEQHPRPYEAAYGWGAAVVRDLCSSGSDISSNTRQRCVCTFSKVRAGMATGGC